MKKIILIVLVFIVSLSLAGVAMALPPKPPASICLDTTGGGNTMGVLALVVKPSSTIKFSDGTQKFYSIQGALVDSPAVYSPLVGSGYMEGNIFHFVFNSTYNLSGTPYFIQGEGFLDVMAHTGTSNVYISFTGNHNYPLTQVPCTNYEILSEGSEPEGSDLLLQK
jgi:hypothetical protein